MVHMARDYLKQASLTASSDATDVETTVRAILADIEQGGDAKALEYAAQFDQYEGDVILSAAQIEEACALVPEALKADIRFAHDNVRRFAQAQKSTMQDVETEIVPGFIAGQKAIPVDAAGCYVPGGRYSHIASAIMTVTTAKVAGCHHIAACSPPRPGVGVAPSIVFAAHICGADKIVAMGGVQGVAAMTFGLFGLPKANILVGPGNQYVAEAKRILFGRVGIDMIAGPTDSLILADKSADALIVATDLVSQAEHGYNSPVWLITDDRALADDVMRIVPELIADLPELNCQNAFAAWRDYAEVILCSDREEMAACSDEYAPEHRRRSGLVVGPPYLLRLAILGRRNHRILWRQSLWHEPRAAHIRCGRLHWRPQRAQIHEDRHMAAHNPRCLQRCGRSNGAHLTPRRHGGPRPRRRRAVGKILPRRKLRSDSQ